MSKHNFEHEKLSENTEDQSNQIQPILLEWRNLTFSVESSSGHINILNEVSGFSNPGELLAVMGQSGCGKTSLLSLLAQNLSNVKDYSLSGEITYNGVDVSSINPSLFVRYIFQDNALFDFLTAYETLKFEASLKLNTDEKNKEKRIEDLLQQFGLTDVQHTIIGNNMVKGLSGGEKKRLSIAVELVTNPSLLILDEPTSGLDSHAAANVIQTLTEVKKTGVNIVFSIHQPSTFIYNKFDRLLLMQDGNIVYQGKAALSLSYFSRLGYNIENTFNPPDYYLKIISIVDKNNPSEEEKERKKILNEAYKSQEESIWKDKLFILSEEKVLEDKTFRVGIYASFKLLVWRNLLTLKRNSFVLKMKFLQPMVYGILLDLLYHNIENDNKGIENRNGVFMFFIMANFTVITIYYSSSTAREMQLSGKEIHDGNFPLISFYFAKFIIDVPIFAFTSLMITLIIYFVIELNLESWSKLLIFYAIGFTFQMAGISFGCLIGNFVGSPENSIKITPVFVIVFVLFSGIFTSYDATPQIFKCIKYITPIYYGRMALLKNEFDDLDIDSNVIPKPKDRYDYDRPIYLNEFYLVLLIFFYFTSAFIIGAIRVYRSKQITFN